MKTNIFLLAGALAALCLLPACSGDEEPQCRVYTVTGASEETAVLAVGETMDLMSTNEENMPDGYEWFTSDPDVATVNAIGQVTGTGAGTATVSAVAGNRVVVSFTINVYCGTFTVTDSLSNTQTFYLDKAMDFYGSDDTGSSPVSSHFLVFATRHITWGRGEGFDMIKYAGFTSGRDRASVCLLFTAEGTEVTLSQIMNTGELETAYYQAPNGDSWEILTTGANDFVRADEDGTISLSGTDENGNRVELRYKGYFTTSRININDIL